MPLEEWEHAMQPEESLESLFESGASLRTIQLEIQRKELSPRRKEHDFEDVKMDILGGCVLKLGLWARNRLDEVAIR